MNTDQLIENLGKAAAAAQPPSEYCFMWIDWWGTCMTKEEWSAWVQAFAIIVTLFMPLFLYLKRRCKNIEVARSYGSLLEQRIDHLKCASAILRNIRKENYEYDQISCVNEVLKKIKYFHIPSMGQFEALSLLDMNLFIQINEALNRILLREEIIAGLINVKSFINNEAGGLCFAEDQADKLDLAVNELLIVVASIKKLS